jgi:DNA mismatch repair protein MutS
MCGVPHHAAEGYIGKLIRKGYKVAICEQMEDPRLTKKIVRREVTRVVTPGTAADSLLGSEENNFLAALAQVGDRVGFAALDLSTGEFRATEFSGETAMRRVQEELEQLRPKELLYGSSAPLFEVKGSRASVGQTLRQDSAQAGESAVLTQAQPSSARPDSRGRLSPHISLLGGDSAG